MHEIIPSVDTLLVLGGEVEHSRTDTAGTLYDLIQDIHGITPKLVLSGGYSGLRERARYSEAAVMRDYLLSKGRISEDKIFVEEKSTDTLTNIIFSWSLLEDIESKKIGIVTDQFHLYRSMWIANRVWGIAYDTIPVSTDEFPDAPCSLGKKIMEQAIITALRMDLRNIAPGDKEGFEKYVREKHPFHADQPPLSAYKAGIQLMQALQP